MIETPLRDAAHALAEETIQTRRDFHQHPEIAFQEVRTSGVIAEKLEGLGLEVRREVGKTGVIAVLDSGRPGKTVLARADIDALPIHDEKTSAYRSTVDGKMHACGHDGHAAVLLSVAKILAKIFTERKDDLSGKVVFIFQPAEEIVGGARAMLEDGALKEVKPDASIGLHLSSQFPTGTVAVRSGPSMAATDSFRLFVSGKGGHAARPHESVDPVLIAAHLITGLQSLVSRETDPLDNAVISLTSIHGGTAYNIIPENVEIKGTLRTFLPETRDFLQGRIERFSEDLAQSMRGAVGLEWITQSPAVVNNETMTERLRGVAREVVGEDKLLIAPPIMGGDDMALWLRQAPGCYFFVGARNEEKGSHYAHHHPQFDLDEDALPVAVEVLAAGVLKFLR